MRLLGLLTVLLFYGCSTPREADCFNVNSPRVLIKGINYVTIHSNKRIKNITISDGTISEEKKNLYSIVTGTKNEVTVTAHFKNETQDFHFRVEDFRINHLTFSGISVSNDSEIASNYLKRNSEIRPMVLSQYRICNDIYMKIKSMKIIRIDKDNHTAVETYKDRTSTLLPLAENGDTYIFTDIKAVIPDSPDLGIIEGETIKITVKD